MSLGTAASSLAQSPQTRVQQRPKWGGSSRILYAVAATEFSPASSDVTYFDAGGQPGRYATVADGLFYATAHLPSGVLLTYVELDYCDNDSAPGHDVVLGLTSCPFAGLVCTPIGTVLSSSDGATGCGHVLADLTPLGYVVDNNVGRLMLNARTQSGDSGNVLIGAYLGYKLQVSPAPAFATFLDVPTTHPYFRFVEALVDSGITAGCGGGNYCVNAPITRGEMAVFLAAALGLHFPN
jgi:hypothetical protein